MRERSGVRHGYTLIRAGREGASPPGSEDHGPGSEVNPVIAEDTFHLVHAGAAAEGPCSRARA